MILETRPKAIPIIIETKAKSKKLPIIENGFSSCVSPVDVGLNNYYIVSNIIILTISLNTPSPYTILNNFG